MAVLELGKISEFLDKLFSLAGIAGAVFVLFLAACLLVGAVMDLRERRMLRGNARVLGPRRFVGRIPTRKDVEVLPLDPSNCSHPNKSVINFGRDLICPACLKQWPGEGPDGVVRKENGS